MILPNQRILRTLSVLTFAVTFTVFLLIYTFADPALYFFKHAFQPSDRPVSKGQCACQRCVAEAEGDPWFADRFNQSVHPLMTRESSVLSEDTFQWWQGLQSEKHPADYREVVEELFRLIPNEVLYMDGSPERCRTCSVVGNSGNLKGSQYGSLIDASEFVIRINEAQTTGFEEDVGTRTTHHVLYPESAVDLDSNTVLVFVPFKTLDLQWLIGALTIGNIKETYTPVRSRITVDKEKVLIYSPTFFKYVHDSWTEGHGHYPSTGFLSLVMALHICDEVSVFGFGADPYGNWHHYWEEQSSAAESHDKDYEYNVTSLLNDKHKIHMFKGR